MLLLVVVVVAVVAVVVVVVALVVVVVVLVVLLVVVVVVVVIMIIMMMVITLQCIIADKHQPVIRRLLMQTPTVIRSNLQRRWGLNPTAFHHGKVLNLYSRSIINLIIALHVVKHVQLNNI
jgi:hypothetical protein